VVVTIGDVRVSPGDIVRGDSDGVVVIPQDREDEVLNTAEEIDAAEGRIRDAIASGMRLDEARKQQQYHLLQRREGK
jgi:4-hydroxy-4-methyl-2-oxoglutarate aldolase